MEYSDLIIFVMEIIGTVAFASSGAMLAIQKEMDLFGVCVLGATTSVGGGMIRDVLLGKLPPGIFGQPVYLLTALGVSVALFCLIYWKRNLFKGGFAPAYDRVMLLFDAIGLAVFTVVGINTAWGAGYHERFLPAFVGVITGVGAAGRDGPGKTLYFYETCVCLRFHSRSPGLRAGPGDSGKAGSHAGGGGGCDADPLSGGPVPLEPAPDPGI